MTFKPGDLVVYSGQTITAPNLRGGIVAFIAHRINGLVITEPYYQYGPLREQEVMYVDVLIDNKILQIPIHWLKVSTDDLSCKKG